MRKGRHGGRNDKLKQRRTEGEEVRRKEKIERPGMKKERKEASKEGRKEGREEQEEEREEGRKKGRKIREGQEEDKLRLNS